MRNWAFAVMIGLIFIAMAGCTATTIVSGHKTQIEFAKIELEKMKIKNSELN